jgi:hypothetical protein
VAVASGTCTLRGRVTRGGKVAIADFAFSHKADEFNCDPEQAIQQRIDDLFNFRQLAHGVSYCAIRLRLQPTLSVHICVHVVGGMFRCTECSEPALGAAVGVFACISPGAPVQRNDSTDTAGRLILAKLNAGIGELNPFPLQRADASHLQSTDGNENTKGNGSTR